MKEPTFFKKKEKVGILVSRQVCTCKRREKESEKKGERESECRGGGRQVLLFL